ncbi:MAG: DUF2321 domain-containing protein, partial [Candidatus Eremiobacteraeota bacterium]|nr:DUF2321 domain-containing protein [Candidatus Eremiobacteraeota bacterium]
LKWVPYHSNCTSCGKPYPWKANDLERLRRTLAEQAELDGWDDVAKSRAQELLDDIAADRIAPSSAQSGLRWLEHRGAAGATATLLDAIERLGALPLKQSLRASFPGRF